jgi:hypothetical protein
MIETFAIPCCRAFLDLNHTSKTRETRAPYGSEARFREQPNAAATFGIGTLGS